MHIRLLTGGGDAPGLVCSAASHHVLCGDCFRVHPPREHLQHQVAFDA